MQRIVKRQRLAHRHKIGPAVKSPIALYEVLADRWTKPRKFWGYKTEVAKMYDSCNDSCLECKGVRRRICTDVTNIGERLKRIGLSDCDTHGSNVGTIGRRIVCIDFGDVSMQKCS